MKKLYISIIILVIILSAAIGAVYQVKCVPPDSVSSYISSFASALSNGVNRKNIFLNSLRDSTLTVSIIFICGFVRIGFLVSIFAAARRCFIAGFTSAAFISVFKAKGILASAVLELPFILSLIPLAALCSVSVMLSTNKGHKNTTQIRSFILLALGSMLIFTGAALCEGYAVPILLKIILK